MVITIHMLSSSLIVNPFLVVCIVTITFVTLEHTPSCGGKSVKCLQCKHIVLCFVYQYHLLTSALITCRIWQSLSPHV